MTSKFSWFDDRFENLKVTFDRSSIFSTWELKEKLTDRYRDFYSYSTKHYALEARAVFICSKVDGPGPDEAIMKLKMQVSSPCHILSKKKEFEPAISSMGNFTKREVEALEKLKAGGSQHTPHLIDWVHKLQEDHLWVPGGYIDFILMEKVPGVVPEPLEDFGREERDQLCKSFKKAWKQVSACGTVNISTKPSNLLWDRGAKKCYILDFERWYCSSITAWTYDNFVDWGLA